MTILGQTPDFIGIGGERCGSTWLWLQLRSHPQVYLPALKEIQFFSRKLWRRTPLRNLDKLLNLRQEDATGLDKMLISNLLESSIIELRAHFGNISDYQEIFSSCPQGSICGDISPQYACLAEDQIKLMAQVNPNIKIIFCVRHPIDRIISSALLKSHEAKKDLDTEFLKNMSKWPAQLRQSSYSKTYKLYQKYFDKKNIIVLPFEMIADDAEKFIREICDFLNLNFRLNYFSDLNKIINSPANKDLLKSVDFSGADLPDFTEQYDFANEMSPGLGDKWQSETEEKYSSFCVD